LVEEFAAVVSWQSIPAEYHYLGGGELSSRIREAREALGTRLVILGHHYQRQEVIQFAD
jgi:quinolinate synthase